MPFGHRPATVLAMRMFMTLCLSLLLVACGPSTGTGAEELDWFEVEVVSASGTHHFTVEIADNDDERRRGLMFRRELAPSAGMLFLFEEEQPLSFWMRNTYISLDIIYIGVGGRIVSIARETTPLSERSLPSLGPGIAVLEVNAGTASRLGFGAGDLVRHPFFDGETE